MHLNPKVAQFQWRTDLTEATGLGKKTPKQNEYKMNYCPKTETTYCVSVRSSSGQVEQNNFVQAGGGIRMRLLYQTNTVPCAFNIPFIQIPLKAVGRRKITSKPGLHKKVQCNLSHSLFYL